MISNIRKNDNEIPSVGFSMTCRSQTAGLYWKSYSEASFFNNHEHFSGKTGTINSFHRSLDVPYVTINSCFSSYVIPYFYITPFFGLKISLQVVQY